MKTTDNTQRFNSYTYANNNPMRFVDPTGYDGFDDVYTGPGMQTWVKPEQDGNNAFFGSGGGGGGGGNGFHYSYTDHAYEDANGNIVGWNYVNASYVAPNAISIFNSINSNWISGITSMSINISDNSVEIKMEYLDSWSSMTNSAGQHVGFDDISIGSGAGSGFDPSLTAKNEYTLFSSPGLEIKDYSTRTRGSRSPIEFVTNLRTRKLESVNVYNIMGDYFSFGTNGDVTFSNIVSFGFTPYGGLILDLSFPVGSNSSVGITIRYNPDVFINNANYYIANTIGDALERGHRIFAPYPFDEELIPEFFLLP